MSESVDTRGVPDSLEFLPGEGSRENQVYECLGCGDRVIGTGNAVRHTGCPVPGTCPVCGSPRGHVDVATTGGRVDVCECGTPFVAHIDNGEVT